MSLMDERVLCLVGNTSHLTPGGYQSFILVGIRGPNTGDVSDRPFRRLFSHLCIPPTGGAHYVFGKVKPT